MMMMAHTKEILRRAEEIAYNTGNINATLSELRRLSLDDYGLIVISLPNNEYPAISAILPRMASPETQKTWTGSSGIELLKQTVVFTRILENNFIRYMQKSLQGSTILDFGCGYGRILRMLYYYSNPNNVWGVDAWGKSLATCQAAGIIGNLAQSERVPHSLPVGEVKFDVAFAFSVFTHLEPAAASACLKAIRRHMNDGAIFIPTIRPVEFWTYLDRQRNQSHSERLTAEHNKNGFAYLPHSGQEGETYGDTSLTFGFFNHNGWKVLGYDRSILDTYQISVILKAGLLPVFRTRG